MKKITVSEEQSASTKEIVVSAAELEETISHFLLGQ